MTAFTDLLSAMTADRRFICHLQPYDPVGAAVVDLYYSTHGFVSAPGDSPSNREYASRLQSGYTFSRSLFQSGRLSGRSIPGRGAIRLINNDGGLDALQGYRWGGRRMRVWMGGAGFALSDYGLVLDATAQGVSFQNDEVTIELRDLQHLFDREIQSEAFAGSGGVEGGDDVKGKRKPLPLGICRNVRPVYIGVVSGLHTWSLGSKPIVGVLAARDLGLEWTFKASAPSGGEYTVDLANATISAGGNFNGPVTVDVIGWRYLSTTSTTSWTVGAGSQAFTVAASGLAFYVGMKVRVARTSALSSTWGDGLVTGYSGTTLTVNVATISGAAGPFTDWTISPWGTAAGILKALATEMGVTSFDSAAIAALETAQPATVGYWIAEGGNGLSHMDAVANGIGGHHGFNRAGEFDVGRLTAPSGPVADYAAIHLVPGAAPPIEDSLRRLPSADPNWQVVVRGRRNWAGDMSGNELAGAVSDADRAFLTAEWRQETDEDSSVLTGFPYSEPLTIDSILDETAAMAAEATRLLAMFGVPRDFFELTMKLQPLARELPDTVTLTDTRYGLSGGKDVRIVDMNEDATPGTEETTLQVWG